MIKYLPSWIEAGDGSPAAHTLFLKGCTTRRPTIPGASVPWTKSFPEIPTVGREFFHPPFTGEAKSAISSNERTSAPVLWNELFVYDMLAMVSGVWVGSANLAALATCLIGPHQLGAFFREVPPGSHRFFKSPPYGFGLVAVSAVGYLVAVEWVGKLHASVVSEPFFLGSPAHRDAVQKLPDHDFSVDAVDIGVDDTTVHVWPSVVGSHPAVIWRSEAPPPESTGVAAKFFKIIRGDGFEAPFLRNVHDVYSALAAALASAAERPPAIIDAELLFGAGELCVLMPWIGGRDAVRADLSEGGCAVEPIARAIIWLAQRGMLYIDLRPANVRIVEAHSDAAAPGADTECVRLVDYDDCVIVAPPASAHELEALLVKHDAAFAAAVGNAGALPAVVSAIRALWP